jgi:hypothetical protein
MFYLLFALFTFLRAIFKLFYFNLLAVYNGKDLIVNILPYFGSLLFAITMCLIHFGFVTSLVNNILLTVAILFINEIGFNIIGKLKSIRSIPELN